MAQEEIDEVAVEDFILVYELNDKAADALRKASNELQFEIISQDMEGVSNASAAVLARINGSSNASAAVYEPPAQMQPDTSDPTPPDDNAADVERFITFYDLDDKAADALRKASKGVQLEIISRDMAGVRNASATIMARIKNASQKN